jgi:hypothetical protein
MQNNGLLNIIIVDRLPQRRAVFRPSCFVLAKRRSPNLVAVPERVGQPRVSLKMSTDSAVTVTDAVTCAIHEGLGGLNVVCRTFDLLKPLSAERSNTSER